MKFLNAFKGIDGIALGLRNGGGLPGHHVNIDLMLPRDIYIGYSSTQIPSDYFIGRGLKDTDNLQAFVSILYETPESVDCRPYEDSTVRSESGVRVSPVISRFSIDSLHGLRSLNGDDYKTLVAAVFDDLKTIDEPDTVCIRLSFDRVQQNAVYAFPARILAKSGISEPVRYRITADEVEKPIEGELVLDQSYSPEEFSKK